MYFDIVTSRVHCCVCAAVLYNGEREDGQNFKPRTKKLRKRQNKTSKQTHFETTTFEE